MRVIQKEIELYQFSELPLNVQQRIINGWRDGDGDDFWPHTEFIESAEVIANFLGIKLRDYSYDEYRYSFKLSIPEDMESRKAYRVVNGLLEHANKYTNRFKKSYYKHYPKVRKSKIFAEYDNCPFTGVCYDFSFAAGLADLYRPENYMVISYRDFCNVVFDNLFDTIQKEYVYYNSFEGIKEDIENRDIEFTKDGKIYYE